MGFLDELRNAPSNALGGTGKSFIDADTLVDTKTKEKYRIQGIDAGEVEKIIGGQYQQGTAGGAQTTETIRRLANEQGFTNVTPLLGPDGQPQRDDFGRILTDLTNDKGESFRTNLLEAGAFDVNKYTTVQDQAAVEIAQARRQEAILDGDHTANAFDIAATEIAEAERAEGEKQVGFKATLLNEAQRAQAKAAGLGHLISDTVQVRHLDRDINNKSNNPFSDSWDQGWTSVGQSAFGIANLIGVKTGAEGLAQWGEDGVSRINANLAEYGTTVLDYKEVDSIGSAFEYLGNNLALSIPYMAATGAAAATSAVGAPAALVAGAAAIPVALYTGQTWNEMEGEKSATVAIGAGVAQAALDRLGLNFIFKKGVAPKSLMKEAVNALTAKGLTKEAAEQRVVQATRREIGELAGVASDIAKKQISAKAIGKDLLTRLGIGAVGEAATEATQEATAYLGATYGSDKVFDWEELNGRLISAAIAGGSLGGGLAAPGAVYNAGAWADVAYRLDPASQEKASEGELYAAEEKATHGRVASLEELAADAAARAAVAPGATIDDRAQTHAAAQQRRTATDKLTEQALNVSQLWQGATRNIFTPELKARSRSARILSDMFGGSLQKTFSGSSFENSKHHRVAIYKNKVVDPDTFWVNTVGAKKPGLKKKTDTSESIYNQLNSATDKDGNFDPDKVPAGPYRDHILVLARQMKELGDQMHTDQARHNPELGYIKNYLFKYKALNKNAVKQNKSQFVNALVKSGYKRAEAVELTDTILDNNEVSDVDEAFSVVKGGIVPGAHKKRALNMSEKKEFKEFMEPDIFSNISQAAKSAARYTAHRDYIGKNGAVVSKLLDDMQAEGVSQETVNKVAHQMKNYLDAESGNYKRPTSEMGKQAQRLQKNFMMLTTLAGLPLATISSFVETMLISKGLRSDQIFGDKGSLKTIGKEMANTLWAGTRETAGLAKGGAAKEAGQVFETDSKQLLKDLGYYDWDVGAATVTGVTEVNAWQQWIYEGFFKWTGLTGYTNFTRAARASIAQDYINDKADTIFKQRHGGQPRTREVQEAEEGLRNLGIDVDQYVEVYQSGLAGLPLTAEQEAFIENTTREATFNFVNEAIALPQSGNRPLIYQDPRFALFTQFQGFIATFTANHIPKLWGEYVKRGTPAMKYNAFAVMSTMIMMGFVSQYLKDLIKYGQSAGLSGEGHLNNAEYLQRGIRASGLLGTGERVLDQFFPIYEQKTDGVGDWVFKTGSGESPALSNLARIGKAGGHLIEGDVGKAAKYAGKSTPVLGPFSDLNSAIGDAASNWNFKGG